MDTRDVITKYYELANAADWDAWCDLFAPDQVMDEQLAGRIEGRETLRKMMAGFPDAYKAFANRPRHVVVDGDQAAVLSHIDATLPNGQRASVDAMNYFQIVDGSIAYMANVHDTAPFRTA